MVEINKNDKIFVAGHRGMVGSAICRELRSAGYSNIISASRDQLDLVNQTEVREFLQENRPDFIFVSAATVGGIFANNTYPANFVYENIMIESNLIHEGYLAGCKDMLFLGSSCIYPREASQPIAESELLTGKLEATNEPYAIAKIAGIKMCESYNRQYGTNYISLMPTNLYGEGDNFHPENSHVLPALLARFHNAKLKNLTEVEIWGTGKPRREFLHVDDLAKACRHFMEQDNLILESRLDPMLSHINIGTGIDVSISELAHLVAETVGYHGQIVFDSSLPDGTPRKLLNVDLAKELGWQYSIDLKDGLYSTYKWYLENIKQVRT